MEVIHVSKAVRLRRCLAIGIGKFDGFHAGHRKIVASVLEAAREADGIPSVFTFRSFPVDFLLSSWDERLALFRAAGVELCVWSDFEEVSAWDPGRFISFLADLDTRRVVVGKGFRFGSGRGGDAALLGREGRRLGFEVREVAPVVVGGAPVSSSGIRRHLRRGEVERVAAELGRPYSFSGRVVPGDGRGRALGYPTANIAPVSGIGLAPGIYAAWVRRGTQAWRAALYVGSRPTFGERKPRLEVFLLSFAGDMYGADLRVFPAARLRADRAFRTPAELAGQIREDVGAVERLLSGSPPGGDPFDGPTVRTVSC